MKRGRTVEDRIRRAVGRLNSAGADAVGHATQSATRAMWDGYRAAHPERPNATGPGVTIWGLELGGVFDVEVTELYRSTAVRLVWRKDSGPGATVRELGRFTSGAAFVRFCEVAVTVLDCVARVTDRVAVDVAELAREGSK